MRGWWSGRRAAAIAAGAAAGASARWAVVTAEGADGRFPWAVLVVNVVGAFLLGVLVTGVWRHEQVHRLAHDAGGIGFCGALTTFSTFSVDVVELARDGDVGIAAVYAVTSVVAAIVAFAVGATLRSGRRTPEIEPEP